MLCYVMLCYVMLRYVMLRYVMLLLLLLCKFTNIFLKQTIALCYIILQPFCSYSTQNISSYVEYLALLL